MKAIEVTCLKQADDGLPYWRSASGRALCAGPGSGLVHPECIEAEQEALARAHDPDGSPGIIGRERALVDRVTKRLLGEAMRHYDYWGPSEHPRGSRFELRLDDGRVVRVDVTIRVET